MERENKWEVHRFDVVWPGGKKSRGTSVISPDGKIVKFYQVLPKAEAIRRAKHRLESGKDLVPFYRKPSERPGAPPRKSKKRRGSPRLTR